MTDRLKFCRKVLKDDKTEDMTIQQFGDAFKQAVAEELAADNTKERRVIEQLLDLELNKMGLTECSEEEFMLPIDIIIRLLTVLLYWR